LHELFFHLNAEVLEKKLKTFEVLPYILEEHTKAIVFV